MPHHRLRPLRDELNVRRGADAHQISQDIRRLQERPVNGVAEFHHLFRGHVRGFHDRAGHVERLVIVRRDRKPAVLDRLFVEGRARIGDGDRGLQHIGEALPHEPCGEREGAFGIRAGLPGVADHDREVHLEAGILGDPAAALDILYLGALGEPVEGGLVRRFQP